MLLPQLTLVPRKWMLLCAFFVGFVGLTAQTGWAVLLGLGGAVSAPAEAKPALAAITIAGGVPVPFAALEYTGTLTSRVVSGDTTNPLGGLTFTYLLSNDITSTHELHRFTVSSFAGFTTNVSYSSFFLGLAPTFIDRNASPGDVIGYSFPTPIIGVFTGPGPLLPGQTSTLLVIQTNAQSFQPTLASVIDGSTTMMLSFAPAALIPEPSTVTLAALGGVCTLLTAIRHRRRRAKK